jgi:hypothetical protein
MESCKAKYPTGEFIFACSPKYVFQNPPVDGTPIYITLTDMQMDPPNVSFYKMKVFNSRLWSGTNEFKYFLSLRIDANDLFRARIKSYGKTSSSNAIAACASDAGLSPDCDATSDTQYWLRTNERGIDFIFQTVPHSWASNFSCFVIAILANGSLRMYDVNARSGGGTSWKFLNRYAGNYIPAANDIMFDTIDATFETISGTLNTLGGYGSTNGQYDLDKGFGDVSANIGQIASSFSNMASDAMGSQRATTMPFKSDNQHENYNKAAVQNLRFKCMYSTQCKIMARYPRSALLLDHVYLEPHSLVLNDGIITPFAGAYFVSEVSTMILPTAVTKNYTLIRQGANYDAGLDLGLA